MRRILPVLLAAMAASAVLAPAAPAAVRSCSAKIDFNLKVSSARNMTCAGRLEPTCAAIAARSPTASGPPAGSPASG